MSKTTMATFDAMVALQETLTTPNSEDWILLPDRGTVHVTAFRQAESEDGTKRVVVRMRKGKGKGTLAKFKHTVAGLPHGHDLGCVTIVRPRDAGDAFGKFLAFLQRIACEKQFSLMSIIGTATTSEAVAAFARSADLMTDVYGCRHHDRPSI
jgi:hypothetical protein